jgi:ABC-2 type transport system ATP-binding protein
MIKVRSLRIDYEGVTAVDDLSFDVAAGHIYGLVGPNGAGKTSTLKALAGVIPPTYGDIHLCGVDLEVYPKKAIRDVGYMPDFSPVYEHLKVWEYLDVFAAAYFCPRAERMLRAREWVSKVRLEDKWDALISTLSRGMRQRLVLAKTLLHDPRVVLLDEPASGLDPIGRVEMREVLKQIALSGKAVIISSHILTELSDMCQAVGIMEKGRMVVSGTVEEIRALTGMASELVVRISQPEGTSHEQCLNILRGSLHLKDVSQAGAGEFRAAFKGTEEESAGILSALVAAGVVVSEFSLRKADVQDIFLKIGARETS